MKNFFQFDFSNIKGDFLGGLTAGIVALPLALAFGDQTALGAMAGLYGAIALAVLAAVFGGTSTQISGPTAPMTVVSAAVISSTLLEAGAESLAEAVPLILATFFLAGVIEVFFGIIRLGKYIRYIPYPVVSGFMSGIGVIIIITQIFPLLGYQPANDAELVDQRRPHAEEQLLERIIQEEERRGELNDYLEVRDIRITAERAVTVTDADIVEAARKDAGRVTGGTKGTIGFLTRPFKTPGGINWYNFLLAIGTIVSVYLFKRITSILPSSLIALVLFTAVGYFFLNGKVPIIGDVESGLPPLHFDLFGAYLDFGYLGTIIKFAVTLAALGAIDSLLTSVVADNMTKTRHDSNRELIGQGIGNMGAALIGGLPGAGATMRTVLNIQAGGKTRISGIIAGIFLLAVLLGLGPVVAYIPKGVLAGILFTVGIGIIDYKAFSHIKNVPLSDVVIMFVVLGLTVFVDLLIAVGVGMVLATLLFMKRTSDQLEEQAGRVSGSLADRMDETVWPDETDMLAELKKRVYFKHIDGPLFFGFATSFQEMIMGLPGHIRLVVFRMERVPYIDQSGIYAMESAVENLQKQGIVVIFSGLQDQPKVMIRSLGLIPGRVAEEFVFDSFADCRKWLTGVLRDEATLKDIARHQREVIEAPREEDVNRL
ncbi:MAG: SulP family inorganic anion transporter [Saprospiraceae bacterium]